MRRILLGLVIILGAATSEARAQFLNNFNDPFNAYYSFYLPRQQAQALSPGPEASINALAANRQQYAATNRSDMFDPNGVGSGGVFGGDLGLNSGLRRGASASSASRIGGNLNGLGPAGFYNKPNSYHPSVRSGRGKNANVSVARNRGFSGGYGGLGGNLGLPGPR